jgi:hypothetical protein
MNLVLARRASATESAHPQLSSNVQDSQLRNGYSRHCQSGVSQSMSLSDPSAHQAVRATGGLANQSTPIKLTPSHIPP